MLRPTHEPGDDRKDPRLAAIPENVTGRALVSCCAGATFGTGLICVKSATGSGRENGIRGTFVIFAV